jgi:adenosine deaminase
MQAGTHCDQPGDVLISQALRDQQFYDRLVNAFSTRAYLPSVHVPTEHDAFFATFARFGAASGFHFADMMIDQLRQ